MVRVAGSNRCKRNSAQRRTDSARAQRVQVPASDRGSEVDPDAREGRARQER
jgi:hypothetical protein